jgi:hypothetical protein
MSLLGAEKGVSWARAAEEKGEEDWVRVHAAVLARGEEDRGDRTERGRARDLGFRELVGEGVGKGVSALIYS